MTELIYFKTKIICIADTLFSGFDKFVFEVNYK